MKTHIVKAKTLSVVWLVSYLLYGVGSLLAFGPNVNMENLQLEAQIFTSLIVMLYFYPLLWIIRYHAKLAHMKRLFLIANIVIGLFSFWILAMIVSFLRRYT